MPEVRVVVLTGEGKAFCSGQDLKATLEAIEAFVHTVSAQAVQPDRERHA